VCSIAVLGLLLTFQAQPRLHPSVAHDQLCAAQ
jgi:hypothetical protein